jgi:hypothetical protein
LSKPRIPVGQVHTSLFQRAIDTGAMMGFGEVKASADYTEGGLVVTPIENNRRPAALRKIVATVPPPGTNVIVVTHKPNILDAFGKDWFDVREGEASVFKPDGNGGYKPIVRIQAGAWSEFAQDAHSFLNLYDLNYAGHLPYQPTTTGYAVGQMIDPVLERRTGGDVRFGS